MKELEKAYVPVNKKLDKPFDLIGKYASVRLMTEKNDRLLVFMSSQCEVVYSGQYGSMVSFREGSLLINGYDLDVNLKYNQLFPAGYVNNGAGYNNPGCQKVGNSLCLLADFKDDGTLYGMMDINTGNWSSMELFRKKKLSGSDYAQGNHVCWYPNGFILPYTRQKGMRRVNQDISLVQFTY